MAAVRYFTRKREVVLKPGESLAFTRGKGFYAAAKPKTHVSQPTSAAPPHAAIPAKGKLATTVKLKVAKASHAVNPTVAAKRKLVVAWWHWAIAHADQIHYQETRPYPVIAPGVLDKLPFTTDCSGSSSMSYRYAGLPDPNDEHWDGQGYTGTLLATGKRVTVPKAGDIGVFGTGTGHHAIVALEDGTNPECGSHGGEHGPLLILASVEQRYQPHPLTWLSLESLMEAA